MLHRPHGSETTEARGWALRLQSCGAMPIDLRRLFENALKVSLATPLIMSCGVGGVDTRAFEEVPCSGSTFSIADLKPAAATDYAELRRIFMAGDSTESLVSAFGTRCKNASNAASCDSALTALKATQGFGRQCLQVCTEYYVATQQADAIGSLTTLEALKAFLGTIDTPTEALLLAHSQPLHFACADKSRGAVRKTENGWEVIGYEGVACGENTAVTQHVLSIGNDGSITELSTAVLERGKPGCAIGRRPCGLRAAYARMSADPLARHFVAAAHLEAASVPAFLRLRDELALHGAPLALQLRAQLSAADEVRHARAVSQLARRFGGAPVRPRVAAMPLRALAEVARDNAVEGCIRETYGALVAHRQALKAKDPHIKQELEAIAADETRHAVLSWDIHEWAMQRLPRRERDEITKAQRAARAQLTAECSEAVEPELVEQAGMPPADEAVTLVGVLPS